METAYAIIRDFRLDGTPKMARDVGAVCDNFPTTVHVNKEGTMVFLLGDWLDTVTQTIDGESMIFTFVDGIETMTERIYKYPKGSLSGFSQ